MIKKLAFVKHRSEMLTCAVQGFSEEMTLAAARELKICKKQARS